MTQINLLRQVKNLNFPEGFLINGQIVTSVSSGNLTVAIKTLAGTDPSTTDPVYCRIGGVVRSITSALSDTYPAGTSWRNAGSPELATKEIDYFVYIGTDNLNNIRIGVSRLPSGNNQNDFSASGTYGNERYLTDYSTSFNVVNIGRFNAILSAGPGYTFSIPATSVIINRPIYETRWLDCIATLSGSTGSAGSYAESGASAKYKISGNTINFMFGKKVTNIGSWSGNSFLKTPFGGSNSSALILGSGGIMNGNNGTFKTIISPYDNSCEYLNFSNNLGVNWGQYSAITVNDFIMGNVTYQI